tara:strand:+ start:4651 stop:5130 length:480 start_codon:yes stop_codon:yes gene_type:complete
MNSNNKENDPYVGHIINVDNDYYGSYKLICIAHLDILNGSNNHIKKELDNVTDEFSKEQIIEQQSLIFSNWNEKYSLKKFFGSGLKRISKNVKSEELNFYYYVPLETINSEWRKNNPNCEFLKHSNTKKLPFAVSFKNLNKWYNVSKKYIKEFIDLDKV